jgi:tetratricopeptide (TPR) repeat protein
MNRLSSLAKSVMLSLFVGAAMSSAFATCGGGGGGGRGGAVPRMNVPQETMGPSGPSSDSAQQARSFDNSSGSVYRVPWVLANPGRDLNGVGDASLLVIWYPGSATVARSSSLNGSKVLTAANERGVIPILVPMANDSLSKRYKLTTGVQVVILAEPDGTEFQRLMAGPDGMLYPRDVEKALQAEIGRREKELSALLETAQNRAKAGDKTATVDLQKIWAMRTLFPSMGKKAAKTLKKLGVEVSQVDLERLGTDALADADVQNKNSEVEPLLSKGLDAELLGEYRVAEGYYRQASELDPADTTALRYLGELYRHQTGEWDKAGRVFRQILAQPADKIASAVALHALGKMTIHAGRSLAGLELFHQSIATYPLPITYRNLAVYWFSEGQSDKAAGYMRQALALDPEDTYNQIFAAVYLAAAGHKDEAIKVAQKNESVLEASYNLAAIWSQVGDRAKAMELLQRHFSEYERYPAVRSMEMKEAREDYMFANLHRDPQFLELTQLARSAYLIGPEWCTPEQLNNQPPVPVRMPGAKGLN